MSCHGHSAFAPALLVNEPHDFIRLPAYGPKPRYSEALASTWRALFSLLNGTGQICSHPQTHFLQAPLQPECISGVSTHGHLITMHAFLFISVLI